MEVVDNRDKSRFELPVEGHLATAAYERHGDRIVFTHTIVPVELEGQGIGSRLVREALARVRDEGLKVVPHCAFLRAYIERHPEAQDLLA
jgi:predicted GNAT family acetyltransferase